MQAAVQHTLDKVVVVPRQACGNEAKARLLSVALHSKKLLSWLLLNIDQILTAAEVAPTSSVGERSTETAE